MVTTLVIIGIIIILAIWLATIYNGLVRLRNIVKNGWSQIDVQLQRRYDLIPNLIETVKGYMAYERGTLEAVVNARATAVQAREKVAQAGGPTNASLTELAGAESALKSSLGNIFALAENYPQLKASDNMRALQEELASTENKIAFSRQAYNDAAMTYNTKQQQFPTLIVARPFGHHPVDLYQVEKPEAKEPVKVKF